MPELSQPLRSDFGHSLGPPPESLPGPSRIVLARGARVRVPGAHG